MPDKREILPSVEEQEAENGDVILPEGVKAPDSITVFLNHEYRVPENVLGRMDNIRVENGRLVGDYTTMGRIELAQNAKLGIGGIVKSSTRRADGVLDIHELELLEVSWVPARPRSKRMPDENSTFYDAEKAKERGKKLMEEPVGTSITVTVSVGDETKTFGPSEDVEATLSEVNQWFRGRA